MGFKTEYPFVPLVSSKGDLILASLFMGFFIGFGYFATYHAFLETKRARRFSGYIFLIWGEILSCVAYAILAYVYLVDVAGPSLGLFFGICTAWTIQINFVLQIIVNRVGILLLPATRLRLKLLVGIVWTLICISVYIIWIPTQLQINHRYEVINAYWDRTEKVLYLFTDGVLNFFFIYTVKTRLVDHGLTKYDKLVKFNQHIVFVSLFMDCTIIGLMNLPNRLVFCQFHSVAFIVKLNIEMAMSGLIIDVAQSTGITTFRDSALAFATNGPNTDRTVSADPLKIRVDTSIESTMGDEEHEIGFTRRWDKKEAVCQNDRARTI